MRRIVAREYHAQETWSGVEKSLMQNTFIQWTDDTCNPVMGCDGCELWATTQQIINEIIRVLMLLSGMPYAQVRVDVKTLADSFADLPKKDVIRATITELVWAYELNLPAKVVAAATDEVKRLLTCYAGKQTENRGGVVKGFPDRFEEPMMFPGRMAIAAARRNLRGTDRPEKPWLNGLPRLVFVSDMADALSKSIPFSYLLTEIIEIASSALGSRNGWLWLSKRPARMAQFYQWLEERGICWPDNLMAMTSVTSEKTVGRTAQLLKVNARLRGLSVEPLLGSVVLVLEGIDWVIVGGESGKNAAPFDLAWARDIRDQCRRAGVAFFMKQLGSNPVENGRPLCLKDGHGGDWSEWSADLRIREMPIGLYAAKAALVYA